VRRADKLATFMCRLSSDLGASTSSNPVGLSRSVMGLLYLFTYSHLVGWPVLTHITSLPKDEFCVCTASKSLTKSLPKILQVNAPESSRNWFVTGHSDPSAIMMFTYDNYSIFCLMHEKQKQVQTVPAYPL
jgi:hypothetical protein